MLCEVLELLAVAICKHMDLAVLCDFDVGDCRSPQRLDADVIPGCKLESGVISANVNDSVPDSELLRPDGVEID